MSLEQAIHVRYAADAALTALVPAARFVTGQALDGAALPFITLKRTGWKPAARTSTSRVEEVAARFTIHSDDLEVIKSIVAALDARFDGASFTAAGIVVTRMRKQNHREQRSGDGVWSAEEDYAALVES